MHYFILMTLRWRGLCTHHWVKCAMVFWQSWLSESRTRMAVSSEYLRYVMMGDGLVQSLAQSVRWNELSAQPAPRSSVSGEWRCCGFTNSQHLQPVSEEIVNGVDQTAGRVEPVQALDHQNPLVGVGSRAEVHKESPDRLTWGVRVLKEEVKQACSKSQRQIGRDTVVGKQLLE